MVKRKINPLTCKKCKATLPKEKYYPYCSPEHWKIAVSADPK